MDLSSLVVLAAVTVEEIALAELDVAGPGDEEVVTPDYVVADTCLYSNVLIWSVYVKQCAVIYYQKQIRRLPAICCQRYFVKLLL